MTTIIQSPSPSPALSDRTQTQTPSMSMPQTRTQVIISAPPSPKLGSTLDRPIKIIVVADIICPWCYVALKEINLAISELTLNLLPPSSSSSTSTPTRVPRFDIEFRPFFTNTTFGSDDIAVDREAYFEGRFGGERLSELRSLVVARGKELGINFKFGGMMRQTTRVHRLLYLAYARGGMSLQQALLTHLFSAFFEEEKDICHIPLLAFYADKVGLMPARQCEAWLKTRAGEEEVKRLVGISAECGISGVPFAVVEGKWAISGGMEKGVYYKVFEKLAKGEMQ